jgi:hypothetical protein
MTDRSRLRVSDAEREQAAADLRDHFADGRISSDELSDRLDAVYAAQTESQLDRFRVDLPDLRPVRRSDPRRLVARRRLYQEAGGIVIADVACVGVWAATGADGSFWPAWVILFSAVRIGRDGWRLFGPAGELDVGPRSGDPAGAGEPVYPEGVRRELRGARHAARAARRRR